MKLASPEFLWLLVLIPIIGYILFFPRRKQGILLPVFSDLKKISKGFLYFTPFIKKSLILLICLFFIFILARPQTVFENEKITKESIDIFFAIDVSESMLAMDFSPNRIEAAKEVLTNFLGELEDDRLGIIVFAGKPFTQSPLTFDTDMIREYMKEIDTNMINQRIRGLNYTSIGDAILTGIHKFEKSDNSSKVLILLTDGESKTGADPIISAQYAAEKDITIYTIGIGKKGDVKFPFIDPFGRIHKNKTTTIKNHFDEKTLLEIANVTGGKYYHAENEEGFQKILTEIRQLEKKEVEVNIATKFEESYEYFAWGLLVLFLALAVLEWKYPKIDH